MEDLQIKQTHLKTDAERISNFQRKLYLKAKQEKTFRFYVLYDKIRMPHFLREAYKRCKANNGRAGVDGMTFADIEANGVDAFISRITEELEKKTYTPKAVLRIDIPKGDGKTRPLGIPTIKDRVVQMATKLVIEPIFEADFEDTSYGFRPQRSAADAVKAVKKNLQEGKRNVFDADLSSYFDTIPHAELMRLIAKRISDKNVLRLIKMWLKCPVMKDGRPTGGKKNKTGTPQGGVISPLLANIYLHLLDEAVNKGRNMFHKSGVKIVRYADDFVLMAENISTECITYLNTILETLKLKLNEEKSKVVPAYEESFDFLGFTFRYAKDVHGRSHRYLNIEPSKKSQTKVRTKIKENLSHNGHKAPHVIADELNTITRGWMNYFTIEGASYPRMAKRKLRYYLFTKLRRYYARKSQRKSALYNQGAFRVLVNKYGLIDPSTYTR